MNVTVRLFALQRQQVGWRERDLALPDDATIADAWRALVAEHPVLEPGGTSVRFARNAVYADAGEVLHDGDELAVIPPVAGGATPESEGGATHESEGGATPGAIAGRYRRIELSEAPFDEALLVELRAAVPTAADGALVLFLGQTRETPGTAAPGQEAQARRFAAEHVEALSYEAFPPMALAVLDAIADEIEARFRVRRLAILHRIGDVPLADASVVIAVAAGHRGAAFDACRYAIEELKARAPIWKSERFAGGSVWLGSPARSGPGGAPGGEGGHT